VIAGGGIVGGKVMDVVHAGPREKGRSQWGPMCGRQ
jgi:hypothetical protein